MGPAETYAEITSAVATLIDKHAENDRRRAAYMIARAALVYISAIRGSKDAAEVSYSLGDEMVGAP